MIKSSGTLQKILEPGTVLVDIPEDVVFLKSFNFWKYFALSRGKFGSAKNGLKL